MSGSSIKGVAEIELKTDRFTNPARQVGRSFTNMEQKGKQSMGAISQSSQQASASVKQVGVQGQVAYNQLGTAAQTSAIKIKQTTAELNASKLATIGMVTSVASLAASFVALEASISNIPKRINGIKKAEVGLLRATDLLNSSTLAVTKKELALDKALKGGKKTAAEIAVIREDLAQKTTKLVTAEEDMIAKTADLELKHSDYADTLKLFSTSIAITALTAFSSISIMLSTAATAAEMSTGAFIKNKFAVIGNSRAWNLLGPSIAKTKVQLQLARVNVGLASTSFKGMTISLHGAKLGVAGLRFSLIGLRIGLKATYVALGPIGWAIIGITVAYEALAYNIFGARDALVEFTKWIETLLPFVTGLSDTVKTLFPDLSEESQALQNEMQDTSLAAGELNNNLIDAGTSLDDLPSSAEQAGAALAGLSSQVSGTSMALQQFEEQLAGKGVDDLNERIALLKTTFTDLKISGIDPLSPAFKLAKEEIMPEIEDIAKGLTTAFGRERTTEYLTNMKNLGILTSQEFDKIKNSIAGINAEIDETKKNFNDANALTQSVGSAGRKDIKSQQKRKPKVTSTFWDSLPPELKGNYQPVYEITPNLGYEWRGNVNRKRQQNARANLHRDSFETSVGMYAYYGRVVALSKLVNVGKYQRAFFYRLGQQTQANLKRVGLPSIKSSMSPDEIRELLKEMKFRNTWDSAEVRQQRIESYGLLSDRLGGLDTKSLFDFTYNQDAQQNLKPHLSGYGISDKQFQNFIATDSGHRDFANVILLKQREEFLAGLV